MSILGQILLASIASSLFGLAGGFILLFKHPWIKKISKYLISFAVGTLLALSFLDLLPEVMQNGQAEKASIWVLTGILFFYIFERCLVWYHCHEENCHIHTAPTLVMIGDSMHNFIDGVIIATTFIVSPALGWLTTLAIFAHEIPQEIGDFSILLNSGMPRKKIIYYNLIAAATSPIAAIFGYFFITPAMIWPIVAIAAGNLIYLALADLIPEIHHELNYKKVLKQILATILGVAIIYFFGIIFPEG